MKLVLVPFALGDQDALDKSMLYDYGGPEPLHTLANLRISQRNFESAIGAAEEAFRRLELCGGYEFVGRVEVLYNVSEAQSRRPSLDWCPHLRLMMRVGSRIGFVWERVRHPDRELSYQSTCVNMLVGICDGPIYPDPPYGADA